MNKTVAIIGGGIIGGGWAARFRLNGWDAKIYDTDHQAVRKISEVYENAKRSMPGLSEVELPKPGNITFCKTIEEASIGAAFIIEAVPERIEVKHSVYKQIELSNSCLLYTSPSPRDS